MQSAFFQVEILTHFGPHRRLWMGPQFAFKTFQHTAAASSPMSAGEHRMMMEEEELLDLDISLPSRPHEQSNPVSSLQKLTTPMIFCSFKFFASFPW